MIKINEDLDFILGKEFRNRKVYLLTDDIVYSHYKRQINERLDGWNSYIYIMESGEINKSKDTVFKIYDHMIDSRIGRYDLFIGLGGGVVGDLGGFVSSTFMRGIDYIQIPTTLLAQVDSSIGGKTGFDYRGYKNIIGSFKKPKMTLIDTRFINSLGWREVLSGIGEILKYGLISDYNFFIEVHLQRQSLMEKDPRIIEKCVRESLAIKSKFIHEDFKDKGIRRKLNFGHTIGHAIESFHGFHIYSHGQAVILGMIYESYISYLMGNIEYEYFIDIKTRLNDFVTVEEYNMNEISQIISIMQRDKKNINNSIGMILPVDYGRVGFYHDIDVELIEKSLKGEFSDNKRWR